MQKGEYTVMKRTTALLLTILLMLAPCLVQASEAVLSEDEKKYLKEVTAEWEWAFGPTAIWDYRTRGLFSYLYGNLPNVDWQVATEMLPTIPDEEVKFSYEEAVAKAKAFLIGYDDRITDAYLESLAMGTRFFNLSANPSSSAYCDRIWLIQFLEHMDTDEYLLRCDCYIDAVTGKVFMIDLNLKGKNLQDFDDYKVIEIPDLQLVEVK